MNGPLIPKVEKHSVRFSDSCRRFLAFSLQMVEYGTVETQTADPNGERFSFYHRLNYITEGNPFYRDGTKRIGLGPGCLVYLPPNMTLSMNEGEPVKLYFVNFTLGALEKTEDFRAFMDSLFTFNHVHDENGELRLIMEEIHRIGTEASVGAGIEIQNLFENLFLHIVRLSKRFHAPHAGTAAYGTDSNLSLAMAYINANIRRSFTVSEMAEHLNISENYLYKIMVRHTGKAPSVFISDLRLEIAKSSLANLSLPVKTICDRLGYNSSSQFSTAFKKKFGISPLGYRRSLSSETVLVHGGGTPE